MQKSKLQFKSQNWPTKKLGEVCDFKNGLWKGKKQPFKIVKVLRNTNFRNDGYLDLGNVAEIETEKKQLADRILKKGDLILERSGGGPTQPVGRVVYFGADGEFSFSNFTTRIRIKNPKELYDNYLWRYLNQLYTSDATETMQKQTTGIRNLNFLEYKNLEIPLPPLSEQKRIVEKIEKLFAKIEEASRLRAESSSASAALLPSALHQIFSRAEKEGWEEKELGKVYDINRGGSPRPIQAFITTKKEGINWIKIGDAEEGEKYITATKEKIKPEGQKKTRTVKEGDLILSNSMSFGRPYILKITGAIHDGWLLLRTKTDAIDKEYVYYFLNCPSTYEEFRRLAAGGVVKNLNSEIVRKLKIPLPPLTEQKKIVAYLDALSTKIRELQKLQTQTATDFSALRQSVLAKAFE